MKNIFIFIPNKLNLKELPNISGYLKGFYKHSNDFDSYYITDSNIYKVKPKQNCIGFIGQGTKHKIITEGHTFIYDCTNGNVLFSDKVEVSDSIMKVIYDYSAFKSINMKNSNINTYGEPFVSLAEHLKNPSCVSCNGHGFLLNKFLPVIILVLNLILMVFYKCKWIIGYSSLLSQLKDSISTFKEILVNIRDEKEISLKSANIIFAKFLDLVAGVYLFYWLLQYEHVVTGTILDSIEITIANLKDLLHYLMGAPIGLKLNHAFNISLARFFFYHISLWRIFLYGIQPLFVQYFKVLTLPLMLGLSFQIAMLSDLISIATFHVYCIYVYAARLFYMQLRGLKSLWRLFIGQKYNPLRDRVDSCQYSHHQLFIGTLAFTVLLFLLPTTLLYYTVFTSLRLFILQLEIILYKLRYFLKHFPLYITLLWVWNPRCVSGVMYYGFVEAKDNVVWLETNFHALSLFTSLKKYIPESSEGNYLDWATALPKVFTGVLF